MNDNDGKDAATWKNRQSDWYNAERRFIFACKTEKERNKWVEKIIMDKIRTGLRGGMANIITKNRAKMEEKKLLEASTGNLSSNNIDSESPYKDENQTPNKKTTPAKRTPVIKK